MIQSHCLRGEPETRHRRAIFEDAPAREAPKGPRRARKYWFSLSEHSDSRALEWAIATETADLVNRFRETTLGIEPILLGEGVSSLLQDNEVPTTYLWNPAFVGKPADWGGGLAITRKVAAAVEPHSSTASQAFHVLHRSDADHPELDAADKSRLLRIFAALGCD